jgi:hypothetical protein
MQTDQLDQASSEFQPVLLPVREPLQGSPEAAPRDFVVVVATERASDPAFCILWQALVADSASPQKIYQGPDYFHFLKDTCKPGERIELLTVMRLSDAAIVGVVPVRLQGHTLHFRLGSLELGKIQVNMINLLGSIPAVPACPAVIGYLGTQLLALFPSARAVFMQAVPAASGHWRDLNGIGARPLATSLLCPWRDCHTVPLPPSFDCYLDKFSAKKRYNLNRQIRQLSEHAGELQMERIEHPAQVASLCAALAVLLGQDERDARPGAAMYLALAARRLLLCHVLRAGGQVIAAVIGTKSAGTLHIHNIFVGKSHAAFSVGTTAMHLTIKDVIGLGQVATIDFGYGTPNHEFRSSHVLERRAQVLLYDDTRSASLLFFMHRHFTAATEGLIGMVKAVRRQWQQVRKAIRG